MTYGQTVAAIARAFPGTTLVRPYPLHYVGLRSCIACGGATIYEDDEGYAWHRRCVPT